jgi:anthranilate phosphoribosyltransferase
VWEVSRGSITEHDLDPLDIGIPRTEIESLLGKDAAHNAGVARGVLAGDPGPVRDIVLLNAAAGLVAFDLANNPDLLTEPFVDRIGAKFAVAAATVDSGAAAAKLDEWVAATNR